MFFFNDTPTTEIYTLSLHDALPILQVIYLSVDPYMRGRMNDVKSYAEPVKLGGVMVGGAVGRSEEHTSELQSHVNLVCRLLLEKKKKRTQTMSQRQTAD